MVCSLPGSSAHGVSQAEILEWVAISSSRRSTWPMDQTHNSCTGRQVLYHWKCKLLSRVSLFATPWIYSPWNSPGQNTGVGSHSRLQGLFPNEGLNPGLPQWRRILYQLSHKGNPRILEWVAYPFSSGSSWPRNQTGVSWIVSGFFTSWATSEALYWPYWIHFQINDLHSPRCKDMGLKWLRFLG